MQPDERTICFGHLTAAIELWIFVGRTSLQYMPDDASHLTLQQPPQMSLVGGLLELDPVWCIQLRTLP